MQLTQSILGITWVWTEILELEGFAGNREQDKKHNQVFQRMSSSQDAQAEGAICEPHLTFLIHFY